MFQIALNTKDGIQVNNTPNETLFILTNYPTNQAISVKLVSAAIPNMRFPINSLNNTLVTTGTLTAGTITITAGNYDGTSLAAAIQAALIAATASATLSATFSSVTGLITIATGDVTTIGFGSTTTMLAVLGFVASTAVTAATSIVSTYPIRLDGTTYIDIICDPLYIPSYQATSTKSTRSIIGRVPITDNYGSMIYYEPLHPIIANAQSQDMLRLRISLIGDDDLPFILPANANCSFLFQCDPVELASVAMGDKQPTMAVPTIGVKRGGLDVFRRGDVKRSG